MTPTEELALIAFPTRELFVDKLREFDLVIFDRYKRRSILPPAYFENIAQRVEAGGALLVVAGPADTGFVKVLTVLTKQVVFNDYVSPFPRCSPRGGGVGRVDSAFSPAASDRLHVTFYCRCAAYATGDAIGRRLTSARRGHGRGRHRLVCTQRPDGEVGRRWPTLHARALLVAAGGLPCERP
jgi:hypothetical protein